jgi:hypothetical protein
LIKLKIRSLVDGFHSFKPRRFLSYFSITSSKWPALVVDLLVGAIPNLARVVKLANVGIYVVTRTFPNGEFLPVHLIHVGWSIWSWVLY